MKSMWNVSLRTKLIGMVGLIVFLLGVGAFINMSNFSNQFKDSIRVSEAENVVSIGDRIGAQFFERYGDVQAFAINPAVQNLESQKLPGLLDQYTNLYGIYDLILVVNKSGQYVASNTKDAFGKPINLKALEGKDFSHQPWFKSALEQNFTEDKKKGFSGTYFEDFIADPLMKLAFEETRFGSSFSAPIKDSNGNVVGVITNRAGKRWFENELTSFADVLQKEGHQNFKLVVGNKEGKLIANVSRDAKSKKIEIETDTNLILQQKIQELFPEAEKLATDGGKGTIESMGHAKDSVDLIAYTSVENPKWVSAVGWTVFSSLNEDEIFQATHVAERNFFLVLIMCSFVSMGVAVWFGILTSKSINGVTTTLASNSSQVSEASEKIAASATQLSESATEQAAALQETVAAVDEISAMVEKNAEAANRSKEVSQQSREAAEKGRLTVESMMSAIADIDHSNDEISQQMESSNRQLSEITKLISDIGTKTKVINEIVFQTKLLSFNASVEAARAGEYGKGFAVVAEEVGNLAQMSGNAAKEISTLLEESTRKVETIVGDTKARVERLMNSSKEKVRQGTQTAKDCHEALDEILVNVQSVDSLVSEIAVASTEQSTGIREISKAVGQMEQVTQQNTAVAQSSSVAAEQLKNQSSTLRSIVDDLVAVVSGSGSPNQLANKDEKLAKVVSLPVKNRMVSSENSSEPLRKVANSDTVPSADDAGFEE